MAAPNKNKNQRPPSYPKKREKLQQARILSGQPLE
jgi:hypothetical protein